MTLLSFARLAPLLFWSLPLLGTGYFHCTPGDAAGHWTLLRSPVRASANHMQFAAPCSLLPIYCQRLKSMFSLGVFFFILCVFICVQSQACHGAHVEFGRQLAGVFLSFLHVGSRNPIQCQAWQQAPLPTELSHRLQI